MIQTLAAMLWGLSEFLHVRLPFAPFIFGLMVSSKGRKK